MQHQKSFETFMHLRQDLVMLFTTATTALASMASRIVKVEQTKDIINIVIRFVRLLNQAVLSEERFSANVCMIQFVL